MASVSGPNRTKGQTPPGKAIAELAARQHGTVAIYQLRALGISDSSVKRRVGAGTLHRVKRGVYAAGHPNLSSRGWLMAAVLACGSDAVLSHRSAAYLWGLGYFPGIEEVTLPRTVAGPGGVVVHTSRTIEDEPRILFDGIPITSVNRTLVDLADVVMDYRRIARAVHEADVQRTLDVGEIDRLMRGRRGARRLKRAIATHRPADLRSGLEFEFHALVGRSGLPEPKTNVLVDAGDRTFLVDFLWPRHRLIVEVDGPVHRSGRSFESDRERDSLLLLAGFRVIRFTKRRIRTQQSQILVELRAHLADGVRG